MCTLLFQNQLNTVDLRTYLSESAEAASSPTLFPKPAIYPPSAQNVATSSALPTKLVLVRSTKTWAPLRGCPTRVAREWHTVPLFATSAPRMWPEWSAVANHSRFWCSASKLGRHYVAAQSGLQRVALSHRNLRVSMRFLPHLLTTPSSHQEASSYQSMFLPACDLWGTLSGTSPMHSASLRDSSSVGSACPCS